MSVFSLRRMGLLILGSRSTHRNRAEIAARLAVLFTMIALAAWFADVVLLAIFNTSDPGLVGQRLHRRLISEGFFGLRLVACIILAYAGGFALFWTVLKLRGRHANLPIQLKPVLLIATAITTLWILWSFIRVSIYYYMRLDIEFTLAIYTMLELRSLIASEILITLSEIPIYIPIIFFVLLTVLILSVRSILLVWDSGPGVLSPSTSMGSDFKTWRPLMIASGCSLAAIIMLLLIPDGRRNFERQANLESQEKAGKLEGPNPYPEREDITPRSYQQQKFFRARFGYELPENTNIVFIVLESARESFVDIESSEFFRAGPETLRVENFFVPVPHSSNSHYSLYTGLHSKRDFEEKYEDMRAFDSLPRMLEKNGYKNHYIYTDHTAFESEYLMLEKLGMHITEKKHLQKRKNPDTDDLYASFQFGMDDIALLHATTEILDSENFTNQPFTISLVMTNSHYPYLNPHPEKFNRHNNRSILGRHRNGVDYGMYIADRIVEEFRKRGLDRKTLFVLMSDHGESFGERGFYRHSFSLYNEEVRVPLVFRHPSFARLSSPEDRSLTRGSMLDVFPTIFDMLGIGYSARLHGRSLFNPEYEFQLPLWVWRLDDYRGLIHGDSKYIYNSVDNELYRLDLHDRLEETWKDPEGHALAFIDTLMSIDYGKAGGVAAGAGERTGPLTDPDGPYVFGGSFRSGGGAFLFNCSDLPPYVDCLAEANEVDTFTAKMETEIRENVVTPSPDDANSSSRRRKKHPELLP